MKSLSTDINLFSREFYQKNSQKFFSLITIFNTFLLVALFISFLFAEPKTSNADTVTAQAGSSVYYASISNNDSVSIPVVPTSSQAEYTSTVTDSKVVFSSTCPKGATVSLNTSTSSNDLTRTGSDTGKKTIDAVAGSSGLTDNTWGYKIEGSGSAFAQVPSVSSTPAVLYNSTGVETNTDINVVYGVKVDNTIPSGAYTNDVVYTVAVKPECLAYTLKFDTQGGSSISDTTVNYGDTVDLSKYTTTKANYIFGGWSNGSLDFTGKEDSADPNPSNDFTVTLSACWVKQDAYTYSYKNSAQSFTASCNGYYKMEVWGASGGNVGAGITSNQKGGKGGYVSGTIELDTDSKVYIYTGQNGIAGSSQVTYNGGGGTVGKADSGSSGGGASDIRITDGIYNNLASLRSRILVAGGGGGIGGDYGYWYGPSGGSPAANGGPGGGLIGYNGMTSWGYSSGHENIPHAQGGSQISGGAGGSGDYMGYTCLVSSGGFGYGGSLTQNTASTVTGTCNWGGAGGSGWYGGGSGGTSGLSIDSGAGGSSYISGHTGAVGVTSTTDSSPKSGCTTGTTNTTCSLTPYINPATGTYYTFTNTLMIDGAGYKWTNTKQGLELMPNSNGGYYASGVGHSGNGFARITYLGTSI